MTAPVPAPDLPPIDAAAVRIFCDVVFGGLQGFVPIRLLAEKGIEGVRPLLPFVAVDTAAGEILRHAGQAAIDGRGVFIVPGSVARRGKARAQDVAQSQVVVVDLDTGDVAGKLAHLEAHLGPATLVVASGGLTEDGQSKMHAYWRLARPAEGSDLKKLAQVRALIDKRAEGDASFDSLHQPIRVAGTIHGKLGVWAPVRLIMHRANSYELSRIAAAADQMPILPGLENRIDGGKHPSRAPLAHDLLMRPVRAGAIDDVTRFGAIGKVIGHWLHMARSGRLTLDAAWSNVQQHNAACIAPPWDETRLYRSFQSILAKDIEAHGPMPDLASLLWKANPADFEEDQSDRDSTAAPLPVPFSEDALAQRFAERYCGRIRYAPARGCWMIWTGKVWQPDSRGQIRDLIRRSCRIDAAQTDDIKVSTRLSSERTITAVEKLVRADPGFATDENDWDIGPMLINTASGVLDLETGQLRPHTPGDLFTRIAGATIGSDCPTWLRFLDEVAGNREGLVPYLQRLAGYCLTGSMAEQVFFFLCGSGANGKSVFLTMLSHILGDYAATAALDTFTATSVDRHPNDLAGIVKARIAVVTETDHGRVWAEGRIKAITGGDRVRVRFLYREFFEADPAFKILVAGNSRPRLNGVGEAMRRRLHLIPFDMTIPAERRDKDLIAKLKTEADGIFHWALDGCRSWQTMGLAPPRGMIDAADAYFQDEDLVSQWIDEHCDTGPGTWAPSLQLFRSWKTWAEERGLEVGSQRSLGEELRARGFVSERRHRGRGWSGIVVRGGAPAP